jgi:predicted AAA+ superfamily ATPase
LAEEGSVDFLFFDEIQNLNGWELFVSKLHRRGYNLILSGSNARLLSGELATALTGRYVPIEVLPFGLHEYLSVRHFSFSEENLGLPEVKGALLNHLAAYLKEGGYPEAVTHNLSAHEYLRTLTEAIFFKDMVKRYKIRTPADIYNLALYLMSNACSEYTFNSLTKTLQLRSVKTVQKYVGFLEETCLFYSLNRFSPRLKTQMRVPRKVYLVDNGLLDAGTFSVSANWNKQLENAVFVELVRRKYRPNVDLFYYRTKTDKEVDFLVRDGLVPKQLIQVCYQAEDSKTMVREMGALVEAAKETGCKNLQVVTYNLEAVEVHNGLHINFVPAWRFLMMNSCDIKVGGRVK